MPLDRVTFADHASVRVDQAGALAAVAAATDSGEPAAELARGFAPNRTTPAGVTRPAEPFGCLSKSDAIALARSAGAIVWEARATVEKYHAGDGGLVEPEPFEVIESDPNLLLTAGAVLFWQRLTNAGGTGLDAATAYVCVGDGSTAPAVGQTDLTGTNKLRKLVSAAPTRNGATAQFVATFGTAEGNFAWAEAGLANAATGGVLLNRFLQAFGTKTSAAQWTMTITCTLA